MADDFTSKRDGEAQTTNAGVVSRLFCAADAKMSLVCTSQISFCPASISEVLRVTAALEQNLQLQCGESVICASSV